MISMDEDATSEPELLASARRSNSPAVERPVANYRCVRGQR
jgi:hypothetical protein